MTLVVTLADPETRTALARALKALEAIELHVFPTSSVEHSGGKPESKPPTAAH